MKTIYLFDKNMKLLAQSDLPMTNESEYVQWGEDVFLHMDSDNSYINYVQIEPFSLQAIERIT